MPIFDTHAHYDDSRFDGDRDAVLAALPEAGVELVLDPGCDLPSSRAAAALAERYGHVYAAAGICGILTVKIAVGVDTGHIVHGHGCGGLDAGVLCG